MSPALHAWRLQIKWNYTPEVGHTLAPSPLANVAVACAAQAASATRMSLPPPTPTNINAALRDRPEVFDTLQAILIPAHTFFSLLYHFVAPIHRRVCGKVGDVNHLGAGTPGVVQYPYASE
jgi:hypothetical protein